MPAALAPAPEPEPQTSYKGHWLLGGVVVAIVGGLALATLLLGEKPRRNDGFDDFFR